VRHARRTGDPSADTREAPPQLQLLREQVPSARFVAGEFNAALAEGQRLVLRSPGLTPEQVAPVEQAARAIGVPVRGELGLSPMRWRRCAHPRTTTRRAGRDRHRMARPR
jgi:UDP-N-acetylmuramoylalanine--D-glutamate ligase